MTKVTLEIRKKIKIKGAWLSPSGLEILYSFDEKEHFETFTPPVAAEILRYHGIIIDYYNDDDYLEVQWLIDYSGDEENRPITRTASWEMFAEHYRLSQYEALDIAINLEYARVIRQEMKRAQAENMEKYNRLKKDYLHVMLPESIS